ncbi:MAG: ribosome silencing factor [Ignavibacteriales bacterium]|nr:MAG: ribosome silencing factor [Ignavibacteriaceae bacterium]MBW7872156.1 ribosome silencing factor [Ignavibacteria bacterium]MCZ2142260.1 ribosome silencing factor [Ignavibacteriales bacterium]OQY78806.1 MAG: ribosome silencing factor [Ignavibacteriales bacterium UTCHB3]MBV6445699.1 Ribosomal silencing factor RsfS [Ignavibacteriaceae bacterium]
MTELKERNTEQEHLISIITEAIFEKKGIDVKLLDLRGITTIADFFLICSAESDIQAKAIADNIDKKLSEAGVKIWQKEGFKALSWILLDLSDIVVHIFREEARQFYNLERLWGDAPVEELADTLK